MTDTIDKKKMMEKIDDLARAIGKGWPKNLDCVELIRKERKY